MKLFKSTTRLYFLILFFAFKGIDVNAQKINLAGYDSTKFHIGFVLVINTCNFAVQPIPNLAAHFNDTLKTINPQSQSGFNLGLIVEFKIGKYLKLHFAPDLAFAERDLAYSFEGADTFTILKRIESTFLDFPLDVRLISKRLKNHQFFALAGIKYSYDLAQEGGQLQVNPNFIEIAHNDLAYEGGGGINIFLRHFKFGVELKYSQGFQNLLIQDNNIYTQSLESLKSKTFLVSFTFGG